MSLKICGTTENKNPYIDKNQSIDILNDDLKKYISMPAFAEFEMYLNAQEVSELLNCSIEETSILMEKTDFPVIKFGKTKRVNRLALLRYSQTQHI